MNGLDFVESAFSKLFNAWLRFMRFLGRRATLPVGRLAWGPDWWTFNFASTVQVLEADSSGQEIRITEPLVDQLEYWHAPRPRRIFKLSGAIYLPRDGVLMLNKCLVRESYAMTPIPTYDRLSPRLGSAPSLKGVFAPINKATYYHFVMEELPAAIRIMETHPEAVPLLPDSAPRYQVEALEALGVVPLLANVPTRLETSLVFERGMESGWPRIEDVVRLRRKLLSPPLNSDNRIFVSRRRSSRSFKDETNLEHQLGYLGIAPVYCEDLGFFEQVQLFSQSRTLIGMHGAGLTNSVFMPEGSLIVELVDRNYFNPCFKILSELLGHRHLVLDCREATTGQIIQRVSEEM